MTAFEKPHPGAFHAVLDAIGEADKIWMVGDSADADFSGARAAGTPAVLVRSPREGIEPNSNDLTGVAAIVAG